MGEFDLERDGLSKDLPAVERVRGDESRELDPFELGRQAGGTGLAFECR
jgi:hypothetical protein